MLTITFSGTPKERDLQRSLYNAIIEDDVVTFQNIFELFTCQYDCFYYSVLHGSLEIVKYLLSIKYPLSNNICYMTVAVKSSNVSLIRYLHKEGFLWNVNTFATAAAIGSIKLLDFLYMNGCPCDSDAYYDTIRFGRYNIVVYLHKLNIPWKKGILNTALKVGNSNIIRYILENGYEVTDEEVPSYISDNFREYLLSKGLK